MKIIISIAVLFLVSQLYTQPTIEWVKTWDGPAHLDDQVNDMAVDDNGNVYLTGTVKNTSSGGDIYTEKWDNAGQLIWVKIHSSLTCNAVRLLVDNSGNVYTGSYDHYYDFGYRSIITKYDSFGNLVWEKTLVNQVNWLEISDMDIDAQNNLYLTGNVTGTGGYASCFVCKLNSSGDTLWSRSSYPVNNANAFGNKIKVSASGNIFVGGMVGFSYSSSSYLILKYNSSGALQWQKYTSNMDYFAISAMIIDQNENVYFASGKLVNTFRKLHMIKLSNTGTILWDKAYLSDSVSTSYITSMKFDRTGQILAVGLAGPENQSDYLTIKYSTQGDTIWVKKYNGTANNYDAADDLDIDSLNNVYVTGISSAANLIDAVTLKYNSNGNLLWTTSYYNQTNHAGVGTKIIVSKDMASFFVSGYMFFQSSNSDWLTIKYDQPIGIHQVSTEIPKSYSLSQNYPNPFNPSTKIRLSIPSVRSPMDNPSEGKAMKTQLAIYDILGRQVTMLVNQQLQPGTYEVEWDASVFPSGVYFCRMQAGDFSSVQKMVLLK